jgi:hypothetical protein
MRGARAPGLRSHYTSRGKATLLDDGIGDTLVSVGAAIGRNEMEPPLCGAAPISQKEFQTSEPIEPQEASPMKQEINVLGVDIAKRVFHAVGTDDTGKIVWRKRLSR